MFLGSPYVSGIGGPMPGRYLYPAAAAALVLMAAGLDALAPLIVRVTAGTGGAGALLALTLLVSSQFGLAVHHQAMPSPGSGTAVHAQGDASGLQVVADRVVVADGDRTVWVHVTMTDRAQHPADFPPIPVALTASGDRLWGVYSALFPERLQAGERARVAGCISHAPTPRLWPRYTSPTPPSAATVTRRCRRCLWSSPLLNSSLQPRSRNVPEASLALSGGAGTPSSSWPSRLPGVCVELLESLSSAAAKPAAARSIAVTPAVRSVALTAGATDQPAFDRDFPDPSLITAGGRYYAFGTHTAWERPGHVFPILLSADLAHWSYTGDVFAAPPAWGRGPSAERRHARSRRPASGADRCHADLGDDR